MKFVMGLFGVALFSFGCAGVNVVRVQTDSAQSTGWFNEHGEVVTTAHLHSGDAILSSTQGYESGHYVKRRKIAHDVATYTPVSGSSYHARQCYAKVHDGDFVTVSTSYGPVRTRVTDVLETVAYIRANLKPGDSGAPVTHRGCIVGIVRARTTKGTLIVLL